MKIPWGWPRQDLGALTNCLDCMLQAQHGLPHPSAGDLSHKNTRNNLMCVTGNKREGWILCKFNQKVMKWLGKLAEYNVPEDSCVAAEWRCRCQVGFPAARGTFREQRAPLDALQNPVLDSWVDLAHLKLSNDIEYLIWKKLIAHSPAVCEPQPTLVQEMGETSLPKSEIAVLETHKAHWAVKSLPAWTTSPQCCHLLCSSWLFQRVPLRCFK